MTKEFFPKLGLKKSQDMNINMTKEFFPKLGLKKSQDIDINMTKEFFPKLGLKKSQDIGIKMTKKQPKEFLPELCLKKSQDIESIYKEPMSREGPVFPIFKRRKVIKRPKLIGKPTLRKIIWPTIIIDSIDRRERYFNPITQKLVSRPTYLAASHKIERKDEELQQTFDEISKKNRKEDQCSKIVVSLKESYQKLYKIIQN